MHDLGIPLLADKSLTTNVGSRQAVLETITLWVSRSSFNLLGPRLDR